MIRRLRLNRNMSRADVARRARLSEFSCAQVEKDPLKVPVLQLRRYLQAVCATDEEVYSMLDELESLAKRRFDGTAPKLPGPARVIPFETDFDSGLPPSFPQEKEDGRT